MMIKALFFLALASTVASFSPLIPVSHLSVSSQPFSTRLFDGKANAIRDRIKSVKNTKKITTAMKLVAAAKVRKAQDAVLLTRPFSETLQGIFGGLVQRLGDEALDLPLLEQREVKKITLVIISGDRGLCGGYNSYIIKKSEARYNELTSKGIDVEMLCIGKKAYSYFEKRPQYNVCKFVECGQNPTAGEAKALSDELLAKYLSGETDSIELIYTKFVSLINSVPSTRTLVPCSATAICAEEDEIFQLTTKGGDFSVEKVEGKAVEKSEIPSEMLFENDPVFILNALLPLYLNGQLLRTLQESIASELAARMNAMGAASDNAGDLQKRLETDYNRARQASVTAEILEIVAGAAAISG